MAVLVVVIASDIETGQLRTTFAAHRLRLAVLLRNQGLDLQLTELQVRLDTKQRLATADERTRQVHRHVTCFDALDDVVFLAFVV